MYEDDEPEVVDNPQEEAAEGLDIKKLRKALTASRKALAPFRDIRKKIVREFVGKWYSDNGAPRRVPNNVLAQAVLIHERSLFARNPKVMCSTDYEQLKPAAATLEVSLNNLLGEIDFATQGRFLVRDALFGLAVMKVGIAEDGEVDVDGTVYPTGSPYAKVVDLDDWVHDTCARTKDEISFCGNKYRVPLDWARNNPLFDEKARSKLKATHKDEYGSEQDEEKVSEISGEKKTDADEYQQYVELWDIWLPYEQKVVTFAAGQCDDLLLQEMEWQGPRNGPYILLDFISVPDSLMPVAPSAHWMDLHLLINSLYRKLSRQAEREKQIMLFPRGSDKDAKTVTETNDGEAGSIDGPVPPGEFKFGGADQMTFLFATSMEQTINKLAGNLESLGGLGAQADTLGQDQLISASASKQIQEMQDRVIEVMRKIVQDLGWWHYTDQMKDMRVNRDIGAGISIPSQLTPEERAEADFVMYNIDIEPHSMKGSSPAEKLQTIQNYGNATQVMFTVAQGASMLGKMFNIDLWNELWAKNTNTPEIKDLWIAQAPIQIQEQQPEQPPAPAKPAVTTRNYNRRSIPGSSRKGNAGILNSMVMTGNVQPSEKSALLGQNR